MQLNSETTQPRKSQTLFSMGFVKVIPSPWLGFLRGVLQANHLANTDNLTRTTKRQKTYQRKLTIHKRGPNKQQHNKNMLRYKTDRIWLAALYDIQPGNGAGLFLQPRSLHSVLGWVRCRQHYIPQDRLIPHYTSVAGYDSAHI